MTLNDPPGSVPSNGPWFLPKAALAALVGELRAQQFTVIAPVARDGVVRLAPVSDACELTAGLRDAQSPGRYRLASNGSESLFENAVGPDSPKRFLFPPTQELFRLTVKGEAFEVVPLTPSDARKLAFVGVRPCELAAIEVQDRVFGYDPARPRARGADAAYHGLRQQALFIAVDCTAPGGTCFCESMGTGPAARVGFDLAMTELRAGFVVRGGSARGAALVARLPTREPSAAELELAELKVRRAREHMGRAIDARRAAGLLRGTTEHPRFDAVAKRCLSCGNCTLVCPTCFCSTVTDTTSLTDGAATRTRRWESCFTHQFSYTTPGPVRTTIRGRYRHWLRHKLCTWWEQFGTSGCVGCGRCITWCPVGIDLTEELAAIAANDHAAAPAGGPQ